MPLGGRLAVADSWRLRRHFLAGQAADPRALLTRSIAASRQGDVNPVGDFEHGDLSRRVVDIARTFGAVSVLVRRVGELSPVARGVIAEHDGGVSTAEGWVVAPVVGATASRFRGSFVQESGRLRPQMICWVLASFLRETGYAAQYVDVDSRVVGELLGNRPSKLGLVVRARGNVVVSGVVVTEAPVSKLQGSGG